MKNSFFSSLVAVGLVYGVSGGLDPAAQKARIESSRRDWKMVVGSMDGPQGRAVQLINAEMGRFIVRDPGIYAIHTLPVVLADDPREIPGRNRILIGTLVNNAHLARWVKPGDIPENGYVVRAFEQDGAKTVVIAGDNPVSVLYGAVDFVEDGLSALSIRIGNGITMPSYAFDGRPFAQSYESCRAPKTLIRSVFTWGHVISDYHSYFRNLARMKLNEVVIWNDYEPLNAREIVACAHSWGVKVIWGFSWGWTTGQCRGAKLDDESLKKLEDGIVAKWRETWGRLPGDGIYFQSFTETRSDNHGGRSVAEAVVKLVNATAARIWMEKPDLRIIFGLHATSVRSRLEEVFRTDPRMDIYWEDFGGFPYDARKTYEVPETDEREFFEKVLQDKRGIGLVYKCQLFQDWSNFFHQKGPYLLGEAGEDVMLHDQSVTSDAWRGYTLMWLSKGEKAYAVTRGFQSRNPTPALCLAGNFNGPIYFATALAAELFWSADEPYAEIIARVLARHGIRR